MKTKTLFPVVLLLAFLTVLTAFPASAEDAPQGKYELTATFITTGQQITHEWYDNLDDLWSNIGPVAASDRTTEIKLHANWDIYEEKTLSIEHCNVYIDLIKDDFPDKKFIKNGMRKEVDRCKATLDEALKGQTVAIVSSGDAGVYGMAGIMHEVAAGHPEVEISRPEAGVSVISSARETGCMSISI